MQIVLTVIEGPHIGKAFAIQEHDHFFVGRATFAHFRLPEKDPYFSRMHFMIEANPPACRLMDLGSTNGTIVNGKMVQTIDLQHGDQIRGGDTVLRVTIKEDPGKEDPGNEQPSTFQKASGSGPIPAPTQPMPVLVAPAKPTPPAKEPTPASGPDLPSEFAAPGYICGSKLGSGGTGVVVRATRQTDGQPVAIKFLRPAVLGNSVDYQRFQREIDILRQLDHPAIVRLLDMGATSGLLYFVMELVDGENAKTWAERQTKPVQLPIGVGIISRVLAALDYAHSRGFVHRDVKPGNVLIRQSENTLFVKLTDFGLARAYHESKLSGLTLTGDVCGTPKFMAPEQITDARQVLPTSDQYAAAATLYWLLTKQHTHDFEPAIHRALHQILLAEPVPIQQRRDDIPDGLAAVIHRALSKDPADRFESVSSFRDALRRSVKPAQ